MMQQRQPCSSHYMYLVNKKNKHVFPNYLCFSTMCGYYDHLDYPINDALQNRFHIAGLEICSQIQKNPCKKYQQQSNCLLEKYVVHLFQKIKLGFMKIYSTRLPAKVDLVDFQQICNLALCSKTPSHHLLEVTSHAHLPKTVLNLARQIWLARSLKTSARLQAVPAC